MSIQLSKKPKVFVIGLDGATFDILEPLIKNGKIPTIARLIQQGSYGKLKSTIPPVTIPAWITMLTGKNPGKLGVYDLLRRKDYGTEPNSFIFQTHKPLWLMLNEYGIETGLINIPGTYPPTEIDGFMVTGMLTPSKNSQFAYPKELVEMFENELGEYELDIPQWQYFDEDQFVNDLVKNTKRRREAFEHLQQFFPCDFYMMVYTSSDRIQHVLFNKRKIINNFWEQLDKELAILINDLPRDTNLLIVSDHGFGPLRKTFFINKWLRSKKYLRVKGIQKNSVFGRLGQSIEYIFHGFKWVLKKIPRLTWMLNRIKDLIGLDKLLKLTYDYLSKDKLEKRVAWRKTKAFSCVHSPHFGQIYINTKQIMPRGTVKKADVNKYTDWIIEDLLNLKDPNTGETLKVEVYKPEEIYSGPHLDKAPNIIFMIEDGTIEIDATVGPGEYLVDGNPFTNWTGTHTRDGIIIAKGPKFKSGAIITNANIQDITPTILELYNIPIPTEIDGKILNNILKEDNAIKDRFITSERPEIHHKKTSLSYEEKVLIEDRLRRLGYLT